MADSIVFLPDKVMGIAPRLPIIASNLISTPNMPVMPMVQPLTPMWIQGLKEPVYIPGRPQPMEKPEPELPNKLAMTDPRWGTKTAWSSEALIERLAALPTYSSDGAILIEVTRIIVSRVIGKPVTIDELKFVANFGAPLVNNQQQISVLVSKPEPMQIFITRKIEDLKPVFVTKASAVADTNITPKMNFTKGVGSFSFELISINSPTLIEELAEPTQPKENTGDRARRKVTL